MLWPVRGHPLPMNCVKLVGHGQVKGGGRFSQGAVTSEVDMCIRSAGLEGLLVPVAKIKGL